MNSSQKAEEIINLRNKIIELEFNIKEKQTQFEESIINEKNILKEYLNQKEQQEKEFIDLMKKENIGTFKTEDSSIIYSKRTSLKLIDEDKLKNYVLENAAKLKEYVKDTIKTKDELIDIVMPRKITSTSVKFLSERFNDITGETLPGIEQSETNFLTIKSNK